MFKKNKLFLSLIVLVLIGTSCKKQLALLPTDTFNESNAFLNVIDLQKGLIVTYSRYDYENTMYINALLSDEVKFGPDQAGQGQFEYKWTYQSDPTSGSGVTQGFGTFYRAIDQVNKVLTAADKLVLTGTDDATRTNIKAQLLTLRALYHFEILERYSKPYDPAALGIAYMKESNIFATPPRGTELETITNIENDLATAKGLFPAATAATFRDTIVNSITVSAIQARVALYKGEWQKAIDASTIVINSAVRPLVSGATFSDIWTDINKNAEVLLRIVRVGTSAGAIFTTTGGQVYFSPSDKLISQYSAADVRKTAYFNTVGGKSNVKKFYSGPLGGGIVDVKAIRIAEMYLIRAEAYAELNQLTQGAADLNTLKTNRITGYTNQTFTSQSVLRDSVINERYKELAFEGFRFFDLKRKGLPIARSATDVSSSLWQTLPAGNFRFQLPLPAYELLANPNAKQNDNY